MVEGTANVVDVSATLGTPLIIVDTDVSPPKI